MGLRLPQLSKWLYMAVYLEFTTKANDLTYLITQEPLFNSPPLSTGFFDFIHLDEFLIGMYLKVKILIGLH